MFIEIMIYIVMPAIIMVGAYPFVKDYYEANKWRLK